MKLRVQRDQAGAHDQGAGQEGGSSIMLQGIILLAQTPIKQWERITSRPGPNRSG
jgi:hypothetical protein